MTPMHKTKRYRPLKSLLIASLATGLLAGCVVAPTPYGPRLYVGATVDLAPPPPPSEVIGVAPAPGYVWATGYWGWAGGRYVWNGGHWMAPRPGFFWVQPHWARGPGGWRFVGGHWRR